MVHSQEDLSAVAVFGATHMDTSTISADPDGIGSVVMNADPVTGIPGIVATLVEQNRE